MTTKRIINNDGSITEIVGCDDADQKKYTMLLPQAKVDVARTKAWEAMNMADQFAHFAAYFKGRQSEPMAGCDNLDNAISRHEEIRLLNEGKYTDL